MAKILIVEDEKAIRNVLRNILSDEDKSFEIDEAENGKEALTCWPKKILTSCFATSKCPGWMALKCWSISAKITRILP